VTLAHWILYFTSLSPSEITGSWGLVSHACNPSYSGGRDEEDHGSKPALDKEFKTPSPLRPASSNVFNPCLDHRYLEADKASPSQVCKRLKGAAELETDVYRGEDKVQ
jgi:hypothetical protein